VDLGKVAWLYGGGGFTGIRSVAYSKALLAMGIRPDFVQGVSVGTLSAAKLIECNWDIKQLEEIWLNIQKIGPSSVFDRMENYRMALLRSSRFSNKKIYESLIKQIDFNAVVNNCNNSSIEYQLVTMNETRDDIALFSTKDEAIKNNPSLLEKATLAAVGLYGVLPPVFISNEWYYDGMTFELFEALKRGCDTIFIFSNTPINDARKKYFNFGELAFWKQPLVGFQTAINRITALEINIAVHSGYQLIENNPSQRFEKLQNKPARLRRRINKIFSDAVELVTSENPEHVFVPHRIILLTPPNPLPTLVETIDFHMANERSKYPGDFIVELEQYSKIGDFLKNIL